MEASALPASVGLARPRIAFGASLLRIRSDDQLVALFRQGSEDAFRVIHDRYRGRLHAYTRQMLAGSPHDSEDALQEIFVRAYYGLRANGRDLALRPWLYRVAHNRCVDELRRQPLISLDPDDTGAGHELDPVARVEQREALRRLIADVQRLPDQQRSALLMRELSGMSYHDVANVLGVSVPAVKSLLVRARVGLAQANEARDTACAQIREELILAHDRGVRASGLARRHMVECDGCRQFRSEIRGVSRQLAALTPTLGPIGVIANLLGLGGGGGAGAAATGGAAAAGGVAGGAGAAASAGLLASGAGHVVTLIAAAVVTAGGAVELQKTIIAPPAHHVRHHAIVRAARPNPLEGAVAADTPAGAAAGSGAWPAAPGIAAATPPPPGSPSVPGHNTAPVVLTQMLDPDQLLYHTTTPIPGGSAPAGTGLPTTAGTTPSPGTTGSTPATPGPVTPPLAPAPNGSDPGSGTNSGSGAPSGTGAGGTTPGSGPSSPTSGPASGQGSNPGGPAPAGGGSSSSGTGSSGTTSAGGSTTTAPSSGSTGSGGTTTTSPSSGTNSGPASHPHPSVARTVAAGSALSGRVIRFVVTRRHAPHHFALGTLLAP